MSKRVSVCVFCNRIIDTSARSVRDATVCPGHCHSYWLAVKEAAVPLAGITVPFTEHAVYQSVQHGLLMSPKTAARHAKVLMDAVQALADEDDA